MKNVARIIMAHGGLNALKEDYINIENEPYTRLVIEYVGIGPRGLPMISVGHYSEQNGDRMSDPEMVFEVDPEGYSVSDLAWGPISITQHYVGRYVEAVWQEDDGRVMIDTREVKDMRSFARTWDRNIGHQGFAEAYLNQNKTTVGRQ